MLIVLVVLVGYPLALEDLAPDAFVLFGCGGVEEVDAKVECALDLVFREPGAHVCAALDDCQGEASGTDSR